MLKSAATEDGTVISYTNVNHSTTLTDSSNEVEKEESEALCNFQNCLLFFTQNPHAYEAIDFYETMNQKLKCFCIITLLILLFNSKLIQMRVI